MRMFAGLRSRWTKPLLWTGEITVAETRDDSTEDFSDLGFLEVPVGGGRKVFDGFVGDKPRLGRVPADEFSELYKLHHDINFLIPLVFHDLLDLHHVIVV